MLRLACFYRKRDDYFHYSVTTSGIQHIAI